MVSGAPGVLTLLAAKRAEVVEPKHVQDPATIHLPQVVDLIVMVTLNSQHTAMKEAVPELQVFSYENIDRY